ncbi:MAG: hypothetical protein WDW21_03855 [Neisseriaceae bacterium]
MTTPDTVLKIEAISIEAVSTLGRKMSKPLSIASAGPEDAVTLNEER